MTAVYRKYQSRECWTLAVMDEMDASEIYPVCVGNFYIFFSFLGSICRFGA